MKKYFLLLLAIIVLGFTKTYSQDLIPDKQAIIDSLTSLDPEIKKYFPRWEVCEPDLQFQIHQAFVLAQYPKENLSMTEITILAAPKEYQSDPFEILLINCGDESMNAVEIESTFGDFIIGYLSGSLNYSGPNRGFPSDDANRDYCYNDIPVTMPLTDSEKDEITNWLQPVNAQHAFTISLFEQALKIGKSGFWLRSKVGTDDIGYHFWESVEAKVILQRPLYVNHDANSNETIPYLINAYMGGGYRVSGGVDDVNSLLSWVSERRLNAGPGGKLIGGFDFHLPFHPQFGVGFNVELPFKEVQEEAIDPNTYFINYDQARIIEDNINFYPEVQTSQGVQGIVPLLRPTGRINLFYHWFLSEKNPENYIRFDLGMVYSEVRELAFYQQDGEFYMTPSATGLKTYKPDEIADWMFFRAEYRNQDAFPFGFSVQVANQVLLGRVFVPLFGDWLYLEGKYSTPVRSAYPHEIDSFFMISPLIRLTI
ncbi:MAG: hypothetical protein ACOCZW_04085 [Bacteroidota bacterium]